MKKAIGIAVVGLSILSSGCATRLVDFTIISSKNLDLTRASTFERAKTRITGEDRVHIIVFIPTGIPNVKVAMDRAIESVPGAVALLDGVITQRFWWIPYIYGQQVYIVEGTPLIDPKLASVTPKSNYFVMTLGSDGKVVDNKTLTKEEYEVMKIKLAPGNI